MEGILGIQQGQHPNFLRDRMEVMLGERLSSKAAK